ncbi:pilus assembly protein [Enterobacter bugandensis]|uniref:pilus assembly protein n=1 Tax=Enterobacter TaxID=547 RepID=UPI00045276C5|nr:MULTISPECIES: pilus assembly protein [Enterobacter]EKS6888880.1 pilus assembly protein [Enterobacter bugandensis]EKS6930055.1 pilus assembly protein [Enterobacter bugandensis]EKS7121864.1 pilus assembly protein [Enterobacter bugandensis]EKV5172334.1 pilus assembly protein [Enterobacter bugandensis]EMC1014777.1 pilus assembly protein [Enterobacter bugandensis]
MKKIASLLGLLLLLFSSSSWAVDCYQNHKGGATVYTANLPSFTVPSNAVVGSKIWESSDVNVTVYCDNASGWSKTNQTEDLFAWIKLSAKNSADVLNNPYFTFGVTYNGADHEMNDEGIDTGACLDKYEPYYDGIWHNPVCNGITMQKSITFPARFRLYVKLKAFPDDPDTVYNFGSVNVLQFDGEGGANLASNAKNLRYNIDGLDHVHFLDCGVDIQIFPENQIVDFGQVNNIDVNNQKAPFSVSTIRDATAACSQQFDVTMSFNTDDLFDTSHVDMGNGLVMQIRDETLGQDILMNTYYPFATYFPDGRASIVTHNYMAKLTKNPNREVEVGPFSKDIILKINYE